MPLTMFVPSNPIFLLALTLPAPERIHAEGHLGHWIEAACIPCERRPPKAPKLTAGESDQLAPSKVPLRRKNEP
jgi:hypothetical protein